MNITDNIIINLELLLWNLGADYTTIAYLERTPIEEDYIVGIVLKGHTKLY